MRLALHCRGPHGKATAGQMKRYPEGSSSLGGTKYRRRPHNGKSKIDRHYRTVTVPIAIVEMEGTLDTLTYHYLKDRYPKVAKTLKKKAALNVS